MALNFLLNNTICTMQAAAIHKIDPVSIGIHTSFPRRITTHILHFHLIKSVDANLSFHKCLQRFFTRKIQTPYHYQFKILSRTHPTFRKVLPITGQRRACSNWASQKMPSCCRFRYYPNHIFLYQKTTSPSYALTKYESSIHASATGRTSIRKKNLTDVSHCSQCKEFFPLVLVPLSLQQHEKQCLRFYAKSKFIS